MTDLEMTGLCAQAMGWHTGRPANKVVAFKVNDCAIIAGNDAGGESVYDPLHDDAQAMALVKKFRLDIERCDDGEFMVTWGEKLGNFVKSPDLNRAIVECVANMWSDEKC